MGWLRFAAVQVVLFVAVFCPGFGPSTLLRAGEPSQAADEPNRISSPEAVPQQQEQEKAKTLREVAQNWVRVGVSQYKRGLYPEAEKSFLTACDYQEYLTAEEHKQLEEHLTKAHQACVERQAVLEHIKEAEDLLSQGQPIKARAHYEKVRNSPYLARQERGQVAKELKAIDEGLDKQTKEITELYNRSVEFYRAGKLEEARVGFVEVARYGLLVAPKGHSAEDYLVQIDNILAERLKGKSPAGSTVPLTHPVAAAPNVEEKKTSDTNQPAPAETELELLQPGLEQPFGSELKVELQPVAKEQDAKRQQPSSPLVSAKNDDTSEQSRERRAVAGEEMAEVTTVAEPAPGETASAVDARTKIIRTYTKAVVDDAAAKVEYHIGLREFDKAVAAVRTATEVVKKNRSFIGDELFVQYTIWLKGLADRIIKVRQAS